MKKEVLKDYLIIMMENMILKMKKIMKKLKNMLKKEIILLLLRKLKKN